MGHLNGRYLTLVALPPRQLHLLSWVLAPVREMQDEQGHWSGRGLQADLGAGFMMERFPLFSELSFAHGACALLVPAPQERSWGRLFRARSQERVERSRALESVQTAQSPGSSDA